jgi:hypothetical protein
VSRIVPQPSEAKIIVTNATLEDLSRRADQPLTAGTAQSGGVYAMMLRRRETEALTLQVRLDVVSNHTAEVDASGPTYSFRGSDNVAYYVMSDDPRTSYRDDTGGGKRNLRLHRCNTGSSSVR